MKSHHLLICFIGISVADGESPSRIAFGSCNDQDRHNLFWPIIAARKPAAFVWGGDAIYADTEHPTDWSSFPPKMSYVECGDSQRVKELYQHQLRVEGYRQLIQENITIFGTIDDHDYGCNNADATFEHKYESTNAFIDFIGEPQESPMARRAAAGHGVYGVKLFDFSRPIGHQHVPDREAGIDPDVESLVTDFHDEDSKLFTSYSDKSVAVFVLDVRTNKDPWKDTTLNPYHQPDVEGDFLGERQWQWLEAALKRSSAAVNVIVNGLQVHADVFPNPHVAESWSSFPTSQKRLYDILLDGKNHVQSPVLISGDVHMTQISQKECRPIGDDDDEQPLLKPLIEMTTSGMTHSWGTITHHPMDQDFDEPHSIGARFQSLMLRTVMNSLHFFGLWSNVMHSNDLSADTETPKQGLQYSLEKNYGELEFDWDDRTISLRSIGEDAESLLHMKVKMDDISLGRSSDHMSATDIAPGVCVPYRGYESETWIRTRHGIFIGSALLLALSPILLLLVAVFIRKPKRVRRGQRERFIDESRFRPRSPSPSMPPLKPLSE